MKIGTIDIGTNSMRLLTAVYENGKLIDRKKDSHHPKGMVGVFYCAVGILSV